MNFSRYTYLESFLKNIINLNKKQFKNKKEKLLQEIDFQIKNIYDKQKGGYWKVTDSDKIFIELMYKIKDGIIKKNLKQLKIELNELLLKIPHLYQGKIRVALFLNEVSVWSSFEGLYESFDSDSKFNVDLVYLPFEHINTDKSRDHFKEYKDILRLPIVSYIDYNISENSPDLVIYLKPYDSIPKEFYINEIEKVVKRTMYICYGFEGSEYVDYQFRLPFMQKIWRYSVFGDCVKKAYMKYGYNNGNNCVVWGNPRVDLINSYMKNNDIPHDWAKKIESRRTVLWTPHHSMEYGTFIEYKDIIVEFFEENKEMALIFRPHPLMRKALINNNIIDKSDLDKFVNDITDMENVIYDDNESYRAAFSFSEAIITDGTSFLREYHLLNRPLIHTTKYNGGKQLFEEFIPAHYTVKNKDDLIEYLRMIKAGEDPLKTQREDILKREIFMPTQGVSEYIKEQILDNIVKEEINRASFLF